MNDIFARTREFIADTLSELRKCAWPTREELFESTVLVIVAVVILGCFVALVDHFSRLLINFLTMY